MHALLPLLRSPARTARAAGAQPSSRLARPAVSVRHHAVVELAEKLSLSFPKRSPQVYVHEGARQALERRLEQTVRQTVVLSITDNRHSMIHATRRGGILRLRLHHMFLDAPAAVVESLGHFLMTRDRDASASVGQYIDGNQTRIRALEPKRGLRVAGEHHDLRDIYDDLNATYFGGDIDARICWGTAGAAKKRGRTSIKLGSYTAQGRLIRIHPRLDQHFVPRYFVAFVVFHEMLHHAMPATRVAGRRMLHPPEFRRRERTYRQYDRAVAWEEQNLDRLLDG
jgi:hypothetical protein